GGVWRRGGRPFRRRLLPSWGGETRRWALARRFCPRRKWRGFSTPAPSAVIRNTFSPTSMPASGVLGGKGCVGTSAQENETYQPSASRERVTILMVPTRGRDQRTASRPIFDNTRQP